MKIIKQRFSKPYGFIDYHYAITDSYKNGLLLFMGSYVDKKERGKGLFKIMVKELFLLFPKQTEVQVALSNKNLVHFFKSELNFIETQSIEYWGKPENADILKGTIV